MFLLLLCRVSYELGRSVGPHTARLSLAEIEKGSQITAGTADATEWCLVLFITTPSISGRIGPSDKDHRRAGAVPVIMNNS